MGMPRPSNAIAPGANRVAGAAGLAYLWAQADKQKRSAGREQVTDNVATAGLKPGLKVMISAGAAGIGRAMAETFVNAGARVHICDAEPTALDQALAAMPAVKGTHADVSDMAQVKRWFDDAQAFLGGLDVMINNAGVAGPTGAIEELNPDDWHRTISVNVNGMYYCCRLAVPLLKAAAKATGDAVMINLSSVAGKYGFAYRSPYSASKWAVVGLPKSLSRELGPFSIRVNAIQPGPVAGPRIEGVIAAKAKTLGTSKDEVRKQMTASTSLDRFVSAQDIANMALFLCSPMARNVSGQAIAVCADTVNLT
jgi:NAD(P)-dependent dehydrogenase (short-subunit alcohol dehydrogenase family)